MRKTAHKQLLHHVVDLCCGMGSMGPIVWLKAGPDDPDGCPNPPPIPTLHPSYLQLEISTQRPTNPTGY